MTQDEIIRMAREAGIIFEPMTIDGIEYGYRYVRCSDSIGKDEADCIERFAAIVFEAGCTYERGKLTAELINEAQREVQRAVLAEREACAKVCEEKRIQMNYSEAPYNQCAAAIRAIKFEGDTGFRPVSEMIAEHKQDPKKAAAIEKAKMRKAEQKPVAVVEITYGREPECYVTGNIDDFPEGVFKLYAAPVQQVTRADLKAAFKEGFERAADLYAPNDGQEQAEQEPVCECRRKTDAVISAEKEL